MSVSSTRLPLSAAAAILFAAAGLLADEPVQLESVTVTASKQVQDAQHEAQSVSVISGEELDAAGIFSLKEVSFLVPNMYVNQFSVRFLGYPYLRGVGAGQGDPAVTTFVDGVPSLSVSGSNLRLLDLERIEILRGPQGTLYGRNTEGGAINIVTRQPDNLTRGTLRYDAGTDALQEGQFTLSGPLQRDRYYYGLAGAYSSRDGYNTNDFTGDRLDNAEAGSARAQFIYTPNRDLELRFSLAGERSRDGDYALAPLNDLRERPHHVNHDFEGYTERDVVAPTLSLTAYAGDLKVSAISGWQRWETTGVTDVDFSAANFATRRDVSSEEQFTQELRLANAPGADLQLSTDWTQAWQIGCFYFYSHRQQDLTSTYSPLYLAYVGIPSPVAIDNLSNSDLETWGLGFYGQTTFTYARDFDLSFGLRSDYERHHAEIANTNFGTVTALDDSASFSKLLPRLGLAWRVTPDSMPYFVAAQGYKAGGFNATAPAGKESYAEETSTTCELGLKTTWCNRRVTTNVALFQIDWNDMQLNQADPNNPATYYLDNVGQARSRGVELELRAQATRWLEVFAGGGLARAEFREYQDPSAGNVAGDVLPYAPAYTWNTGALARHPLNDRVTLFGAGEVVGVGRLYYDAANGESQAPYALVNLRGGLTIDKFEVALWVKNLLDRDYIPLAFPLTPGSYVGESGAPRTVGLSLAMRF